MTHFERSPEAAWRRLRLAELPVGGVITLEEMELILGGLVPCDVLARQEWRIPLQPDRRVIVADGQVPFTAQFGPAATDTHREARFRAEWWANPEWLRERMPACRILRYRRVR